VAWAVAYTRKYTLFENSNIVAVPNSIWLLRTTLSMVTVIRRHIQNGKLETGLVVTVSNLVYVKK